VQLVRSGWPYLSDDELLLDLVDGSVEARGFRSFFAVSAGQHEPFKHCFEPETIPGSQRTETTLPRVLLFMRLTDDQDSRFAKLTQSETMARLIRACPWATYDIAIAGANLELLSALARQASGFDLHAGLDLLEPDHAAELFLKALRAS